MLTKLNATVDAVLLGALLLAAPTNAQDTYAEPFDRFGHTLARGDFNGDGRLDLAVGVPYEQVIGGPGQQVRWAGVVDVIYGAANGLSSANRQMWRQGLAGINDVPEENDVFGWSLAAADFNADGFDDLAVGVPAEDVNGVMDAGAVHVIFGSPQGLSTAYLPDQLWHQDRPNVSDVAEPTDNFGASLTTGDFDADGYGDLAIGVPGQSSHSGAVHMFYGGPTGLSSLRNRVFMQGSLGIADLAEPDDAFGSQVAAGDFNSDGYDDLAIGVPGENSTAGAVHIVYGRTAGLDAPGNQFIHQDSPGMYDVSEPGDRFGRSLAAGDFNGDGFDDLADRNSVTRHSGASRLMAPLRSSMERPAVCRRP